jgi:sulfite reductase (NADPH) flavoprotein alpha-component
MSKPLLILFATQTGNAESVADKVAAVARTRGYEPRTWNVDGFDTKSLANEPRVLFVASTYGEGDPPDNAHTFWDEVQTLSGLSNLRYSVYALGDSTYADFCGFGRKLDETLETAGATRLVERCANDLDYEAGLDGWIEAVFRALESEPVSA